MAGEGTPRLAVVIVTLGDDDRLGPCIEALAAEAVPGLELAVVQNGVTGDGPSLRIEPSVRLRRPENPGFGAAVEDALARTTAPEVLSLNADVVLDAGSLAAARARLSEGVGGVAFRLLRPDRATLDSAGIRLGLVRRARDRGMGAPADGRHLTVEDVDAACMACALFRREALQDARDGAGEILDRRFLAYKEDVDLGWRLRRAGWRVVYDPAASAVHERGWREGARRRIPVALRRESLKNRWLTIAKNETTFAFIARLPLYILVEAATIAYLVVREPRVLLAYTRFVSGVAGSFRRRRLARDRAEARSEAP